MQQQQYTPRELHNALQDTFGFDSFKNDEQKRAFECIMSGEKNIVISMATQAGKSLCYQLPRSFQRDGLVLVISPNLSLITNQLTYLNDLRIPATSITSVAPLSNRKETIKDLRNYDTSPYEFLYLTPEMLINGSFNVQELIRYLMQNGQITHVAVDEAHKIIDYEKDYRHAFGELRHVRERFPDIPWIALTTASNETLAEITKSLGMINSIIIKGPSDRPNIKYDVKISKGEKDASYRSIIEDLLELEEKEEGVTKNYYASGIIYCNTNNQAEDIAASLSDEGVSAEAFHGSKTEGPEILKKWKEGKFPVIVATEESFGLGINRTPLQFVVHLTYPRNIRAFYQQSGRVNANKGYSRIYINKKINGEPMGLLREFIYYKGCRHQYIAKYFGDNINACKEMCDNCVQLNED